VQRQQARSQRAGAPYLEEVEREARKACSSASSSAWPASIEFAFNKAICRSCVRPAPRPKSGPGAPHLEEVEREEEAGRELQRVRLAGAEEVETARPLEEEEGRRRAARLAPGGPTAVKERSKKAPSGGRTAVKQRSSSRDNGGKRR
jgi:hypothetical protein